MGDVGSRRRSAAVSFPFVQRPAQSDTRQRPHTPAITRTRVQHDWTLHNTQHAPPLPSHSTGSSASQRIASAPGPAQTRPLLVLVTPAVRPALCHSTGRACRMPPPAPAPMSGHTHEDALPSLDGSLLPCKDLPGAASASAAALGVVALPPAAALPVADVSALNPRRVANSYQSPPPSHPHPFSHQRMLQHMQQHKALATGAVRTAASTDGAAPVGLAPFDAAAAAASASPEAIAAASELASERERSLQQQVAQLQAERLAAQAELESLRSRLRQIDDHTIRIPPTVAAPTNTLAAGGAILNAHWSEEQAMTAWQQSRALDVPLPLPELVHEFDAEAFLCAPAAAAVATLPAATVAGAQQLHADVSMVLDHLKPSRRSESRRAQVLSFLKLLVRKCLGAQVYPLGAYALKTYVGGDECMDVSAFFSRAHENTWLSRITNALCQEAAANHHCHTSAHATSTPSPHYAVSELSVSFAKQRPYIAACIGGIHVNIYGNHVSGLSSLALFERVDLVCGTEHLFKRTVLLLKCWSMAKAILNVARAPMANAATSGEEMATTSLPLDGLLSGMFLRTLVLCIFNMQRSEIRTPIEGLYRLLHYLQDFNWDEHALTVDGAVTLASLEAHGCSTQAQTSKWEYVTRGPSAWPAHNKPFLSRDMLRQYCIVRESKSNRTASTEGASFHRTSSSTSLGAVSSSPSARSISDNSLSFPGGRCGGTASSVAHTPVGSVGPSTTISPCMRPVNVHASVTIDTNTRSSHSQSFSSIDSLDSSPRVHGSTMARSIHSRSLSNLNQLTSSSHSQQRRGDDLARSYSPSNPDTPTDGSASLTPSHSTVDLQRLLMGIGVSTSSPSAANAAVPPLSNAAVGAGRLGFISSAVAASPLRSSASAVQLNRLPLPVSASSSSFFSSHLGDGYSDTESNSPDAEEETHVHHQQQQRAGPVGGVRRSALSSNSLADEEELEGVEYLDVGASPIPPDDEAVLLPAYVTATPTASTAAVDSAPAAASDNQPFVRCALNVLDPVDSTHNLGVSISYRHEFRIRKVLQEGFVELKSALQKFAFAHASKHDAQQQSEVPPPTPSDNLANPVLAELFEADVLRRYKESLRRDERSGRRTVAGSPVPPAATLATPTAPVVKSASVGNDMASLWSTPSSAAQSTQVSSSVTAAALPFQLLPGPFSSSAFSAEVTSRFSPPRALTHSLHSLHPHSSQLAPAMGGVPTSNLLIVDDAAVDAQHNAARNQAASTVSPSASVSASAPALLSTTSDGCEIGGAPATAQASTTPSASSVFDSLSGDLDRITANLSHARQFETPDLSENDLVLLIIDLLRERVSVPVGRMGSLLHDATNCHSLPAMLKERYGGLKRLVEKHSNIFAVGKDHPYNPNVNLRPKYYQYAPARPTTGSASGVVVTTLAPTSSTPSGNHSAHSSLTLSSGLSHSSGNLSAMGGQTVAADGSRRKLQRRRTRTRRTNSGAATAASTAAVNAVRAAHPSGALLLSDPASVGHSQSQQQLLHSSSVGSLVAPSPSSSRVALTHVLALDCEMIGAGSGGLTSLLARVSIVNQHGEVVYDKFVRPSEAVTDYRSGVSGLTPAQLDSGSAIEFRQAQREVSQLVKNRTVVGHGLMADLQALCMAIPKAQLRDTATFKLFCPHRPLPLRQLVREHLHTMSEFAQFQQAEHSSVTDARAALALYNLVAPQWEALLQAEAQQIKGAQQTHHANPNQHHNTNNNLLMHAHHSYSQPNLTSHAQQQQPSLQLQLHHSSPPRDSHVPMHMHAAKMAHQQSPASQQQQHQQQQHSQPPLHAHPSQSTMHGGSGHYHALPLPVSSPHQSPHLTYQVQQSHPPSASLQYRRPSPVHAPAQLQSSPSHLSIGGAHRDGLLAAHYDQGRATTATFGQHQQQQHQQLQQQHQQLQQHDFEFALRREHAQQQQHQQQQQQQQQASQLQFHC